MKFRYKRKAWYLYNFTLIEGYVDKRVFHTNYGISCGFDTQEFNKNDVNRILFYSLSKAIRTFVEIEIVKGRTLITNGPQLLKYIRRNKEYETVKRSDAKILIHYVKAYNRFQGQTCEISVDYENEIHEQDLAENGKCIIYGWDNLIFNAMFLNGLLITNSLYHMDRMDRTAFDKKISRLENDRRKLEILYLLTHAEKY